MGLDSQDGMQTTVGLPVDLINSTKTDGAICFRYMLDIKRGGRRSGETLTRFSRPEGWDLHVIRQHQILGIGLEGAVSQEARSRALSDL